MASHWPPEYLPMREVKLPVDWLHRRLGVTSSQTKGTSSARSVIRQRDALIVEAIEAPKSEAHFPAKFALWSEREFKKQETGR
jgi:hypothetical protein